MNNPLSGTDPTGYISCGAEESATCLDKAKDAGFSSVDITENGEVVGTFHFNGDNNSSVGQMQVSLGGMKDNVIKEKDVSNVLKDTSPKSKGGDNNSYAGDALSNSFPGQDEDSLTAALPLLGRLAAPPGSSSPYLNDKPTPVDEYPPGLELGKGRTTLFGELGGGGSPAPDPDDEETMRLASEPKVQQFNNTIKEQYYNTPPLRRLVHHNGKWRTTDGAGNYFTAKGEYEFVTIKGNTFVGRPGTGHYHISHGSNSVDFAGHIRFGRGNNRGQIQYWNNNSGHYKPTPDRAWQARLPMDKFNAFK